MAAVAEMGAAEEPQPKENDPMSNGLDQEVMEQNNIDDLMEVVDDDQKAASHDTETEDTESQAESQAESQTTETDPEEKMEEESEELGNKEEVHEIDDDDEGELDEEDKSNGLEAETIELNDSGGEEDVMIIESEPKENGTIKLNKETEIIDLEKADKTKDVSPRRSPRKLCKKKVVASNSEESDIEEVLPQDPLAVNDAVTVERVEKKLQANSSTIVVKDTKRLVEIAAKSSGASSGKKEPTLVIIDTNSILSGRGPVPVSKSSSFSSVLPMALPAQGMYPANMRATITPIPMNQAKNQSSSAAPLLPTLTDDMFVVEAPSFIVPYVYEKPPVKDFKEFVKDLKTKLVELAKEEEKKKKEEAGEDDDVEEVDSEEDEEEEKNDPNKPYNYFESPLGKFFIDIGFNLVQEYVQSDLLKQQKRKRDRERGQNKQTDKTIQSLLKNLEFSKENNEPFKMAIKKCEFCNFKTESALAMAYHLETPHMKNFVYKCNFCSYEVRSPHDILFHMEAEHAVRGHLERAPAFHQCPNCPFEDNQKGKLSRHLVACMKKFKPERNLEAPVDWEPPAKIPRVPKMRQQGLNATAAAYQALSKTSQYQFLSKMQLQSTATQGAQRGRGRPALGAVKGGMLRPSGMVFKQQGMSGGSVLVPTNYQLSGSPVYQVVGGQEFGGRVGGAAQMSFVQAGGGGAATAAGSGGGGVAQGAKKAINQPSISITPLPRAPSGSQGAAGAKPGDNNSKNSFVICEICDGYIKDLEQLRNHMQWIHKIKIHPKMIYNRPPLNCQKCQFRFFTDQGLERHLLGSHGLVTSSMQDNANKSKDSGRCPVCGRVYQWKLLNHVARDHNMTLKPAHLSYKCTVCTATFGMYKQFENHVYSAHSVVAKRVMDKKGSTSSSSPASSKNDQLKPLKINDEITIIPQPAKPQNGSTTKEGSPSSTGSSNSRNTTPGTSKSVTVGDVTISRLRGANASPGKVL